MRIACHVSGRLGCDKKSTMSEKNPTFLRYLLMGRQCRLSSNGNSRACFSTADELKQSLQCCLKSGTSSHYNVFLIGRPSSLKLGGTKIVTPLTIEEFKDNVYAVNPRF